MLHSARFELGSRPIAVHLRGFENPGEVVANARSIIEALGDRFGEFEGEHYVISLFPRERIRAGTAIENAFVCLLNPFTEAVQRKALIAHEFFHNWLPRSASIGPAQDGSALDEFRFDWFLEGFTEYVARRSLLDAGFIRQEDYVHLFNADLEEQERNPQRAASLEEVGEAIVRGTYTNHHERTSYFRGPLIACAWDHQLRTNAGMDLLEVIVAFIEEARTAGGALEEDEFFDLLEIFGLDARGAYQRHIVDGFPPNLPDDVFGPDFEAVEAAPSKGLGGGAGRSLRFVRRDR